ncbi:polysaccharide deacetylase family protein [Neobacillus niacini]|uniref:polysaccharide deacetylase family protein n=1 Tax=Neobacillus niacini TaxID=86668 RepID=UPI003983C303
MILRAILVMIFSLFFLAACESENKSITQKNDMPQKQTELTEKEMDSVELLLNEINEKAKLGLVEECEFSALDSTIDQVKSQWGEPDKVDTAGSGYYAVYEKLGITFGYNENGQIFDVRSYSADLQTITFEWIKKSFGDPVQQTEFKDDNIYIYQVNEHIQLKFIISKESKVVDHISVFNQKKTNLEKENYYLEIKGKSNQLSPTAWERMLKWREQIVHFSKGHDNVFVNGPNKKMVALTFDDGPDSEVTSAVIDILEEYDVIGNFFFVGNNVKKYPEVVKKAFENGHLVLNHTYNHIDLTQIGNGELRAEIEKTEAAIELIIGKKPAMIRPPFGETDDQVVSISKEAGYSIVLWSIDTLDWSQKEASNIVKNVVENVRNGDIILMHTTLEQSETLKALPMMIEELQKRNIEMVGLDTLLDVEPYK